MTQLTDTAEAVLQKRYYLEGEDWAGLCSRVAAAVAGPERGGNTDYDGLFFSMIYNLDFLPNSPCLMNAGTELGQLSACFVLPIEDTLAGIFEAVKNGALVNKTGGGTGYSFSRLRGKDATVCSTNGVASGPISFAGVFDKATDVIKQGGRRRGANMGVLRVDHPDIMEWIDCKRDKALLTNFNLSVAVTDAFMGQVAIGGDYALINPATGEEVGRLNAAEVFNKIIDAAWDNGEPGMLFIDAANASNPTPHLGKYEATNPCGEQWLLPFESCNLGSINLGNFVVKDHSHDPHCSMGVDYQRLQAVVHLAVRFLDNVVDVSKFPIPQITEATLKTRKLGLGIMGLHDMLVQLEIPYASAEGRALASDVMRYIRDIAGDESVALSIEKSPFPAFIKGGGTPSRRNAALTSIQPTGTVSMIADCSSGCEPYFALVNRKNVMDGENFLMANKLFEKVMTREGLYSGQLMQEVAENGTVVGNNRVPEKWQRIFACAQDISVDDHILMQAALQNNGVDASISKTINMPGTATKEDVKQAYLMGWELGCKGLTVYRDGCRENQVLTAGVKACANGGKESVKELTAGPYSGLIDSILGSGFIDRTVAAFMAKPVKEDISACKMILPDVLNSKRFKVKSKDGESIYIIICFTDDLKPVEVFAKFAYDNRIEQQEQSTMWTTVCRMVSLSLRCGVPVDEIVKQLDKSSGSMFDLPAQLSKLFKGFMAETPSPFRAACPDCLVGSLVFQEGCNVCSSCGYSKCS